MFDKIIDGVPYLYYLGQTGYLFVGEGVNLLFDPYLTDSVDRLCSDDRAIWRRNYDPPVTIEELFFVDLVLLSHDHLDHTDPETLQGIVNFAPEAKFAASAAFSGKLTEYGVPADRIIPLEVDVPFEFTGKGGGTVTVTPIPSAHEELHPCTSGGYAEMGFIIDFMGKRVYHGGDTCVYDGLSERIRGVNVAILPVNGRDEARHAIDVIGNMTAVEAAALADESGVGLVLPSHWDLYDGNGETEENIITAFEMYPGVSYRLMKPLEFSEVK